MHKTCGSARLKLPLEFGKPVQCLGCGERFSAVHELAYELYTIED